MSVIHTRNPEIKVALTDFDHAILFHHVNYHCQLQIHDVLLAADQCRDRHRYQFLMSVVPRGFDLASRSIASELDRRLFEN